MGSRKYPEATEHAKTTKVKIGVIDINLFCMSASKKIFRVYIQYENNTTIDFGHMRQWIATNWYFRFHCRSYPSVTSHCRLDLSSLISGLSCCHARSDLIYNDMVSARRRHMYKIKYQGNVFK